MNTDKKTTDQGLPPSTQRWQWWAGAAAATLSTVTAAQASDITVPLIGNYLSTSGGDHLNYDLLNDGTPILAAFSVFIAPNFTNHHQYSSFSSVRLLLINTHNHTGKFLLASATLHEFTVHGARPGSHIINTPFAFEFTDPNVNGGNPTEGTLEITESYSSTVGTITLDSFTYDSTSPAPDNVSTLALLALGAGGVLAFRQRRGAA